VLARLIAAQAGVADPAICRFIRLDAPAGVTNRRMQRFLRCQSQKQCRWFSWQRRVVVVQNKAVVQWREYAAI
jgi:hypothetical protein